MLEVSAAALARRRARRRWHSAGASEGGKGRPTGPDGPKGRVGQLAAGPIGPEAEKNPLGIKIGFFEFTKALQICTRRFRRNVDTRIFPKFF
jgi:hypothetical protein